MSMTKEQLARLTPESLAVEVLRLHQLADQQAAEIEQLKAEMQELISVGLPTGTEANEWHGGGKTLVEWVIHFRDENLRLKAALNDPEDGSGKFTPKVPYKYKYYKQLERTKRQGAFIKKQAKEIRELKANNERLTAALEKR